MKVLIQRLQRYRLSLMIVLAPLVAILIMAIYVLFMVSTATQTSNSDIKAAYHYGFDTQAKNGIQTATSIANYYYQKEQKGVLTQEIAQKLAADDLRNLHYGTNGYFWVDDIKGITLYIWVMHKKERIGSMLRMLVENILSKKLLRMDRIPKEDIQITLFRSQTNPMARVIQNVAILCYLNLGIGL